MADVNDALGDTIIKATIEKAILLDEEAYVEEFGSPSPKGYGGDIVAIVYAGGDKEYIQEKAAAEGLSFFYKDEKLYVDARDMTGVFFIFE